MERRDGKVSFHKSGSGRGAKVTIPIPWLRKMGISEEDREITFTFDEEASKVIIEKK
ncbi:AbrB/MazE/SpoVT family DNA-binding domain-containing protein [Leptotrichia sp. OH3620_COT-345]|uniref:AbrB/MazE/SpoVT family DNA-binding domain-containing protein n=1 Tax=Leptotrichia sp. OH3620_COT-345 TaxID=2491048 RepID=UPI000F64A24C|nr:AbrB/MazE/SpoVT family DNA-binding domain-containing protein [Leptotrichia sp. OH3620_COT-345]RRD38791.1 AbrB/MazE/SpoVT family DNA-binding domain-containing protein [Leptotrichia sp. OH3620_COT-345]